jgi:hypothetical protein
MNTQVLSANDSLKNYYGGEHLFNYPCNKIQYTEGISEIAKKTQSFWFLDIIASYQNKLHNEEFQVWKLEREYSYSVVDGVRVVGKRKDCFNVVCEDGNDNELIRQHIPFSDFPFDCYTVWCANGILYLPVEH